MSVSPHGSDMHDTCSNAKQNVPKLTQILMLKHTSTDPWTPKILHVFLEEIQLCMLADGTSTAVDVE